ncbi:hypothetical protein OIDMADRAFT_158434 [Oidiodendron maius Zn]|uniref:dolichol kinase n=1 Tax=Oidiodendron maius (strain Zn) TaxID=913774 RepID=A0A0C3HKY8_OIDMZ|nr:hypothetical protein OIDMADRAFT_158434 [Oidiodendron maius Zn]
MAEQLKSPLPQSYASTLRDDAVRRLSRSPHPYHKQKSELPYASERFSPSGSPNIAFWPAGIQDDEVPESQTTISERYRESTNSDSGTEADDEHFLKGLPAPRLRPPKGLRGIDGSLSGTSTPLLSSAIVDDVGYRRLQSSIKRALSHEDLNERDVRKAVESFRYGRRIEIVRRVTESSILGFVGIILCFNPDVRELVSLWKKELSCQVLVITSLIIAYPLRLLRYINPQRPWRLPLPLAIPASFDPASLLYPPTITIFVSLLIFLRNPAGLLPGIILSISSLPRELIPSVGGLGGSNTMHWALSSIPLLYFETTQRSKIDAPYPQQFILDPEILIIIPPLHQALSTTLHYLTTTSLLPAELQMLSISSIYLLLLASSPQAVILKAVLWIGGIGLLVTCERVLRWGVALARVPRWRFRRVVSKPLSERMSKLSLRALLFGRLKASLFAPDGAVTDSSDDDYSMNRSKKQMPTSESVSNDSYIILNGNKGHDNNSSPNRKRHTLQAMLTQSTAKAQNEESCHLGWVQHLRHASFGAANTRLILSAYWLAVIVFGLAIVFRLSTIVEVDTRRKVFHFMMVAMLLPATYVDPTFAALSLSLILAIFLLLDLFRASQLPPLSKSLAYFLAPYVDGRDLKGPVVISHIFLLIGCAIPLWLSLGALPRTGQGALSGWEVPHREVSMVSGVICVGMGDAAASLVGRRYGHRKWLWRGGKSIEGSAAFALAVGVALGLAKAWLRIGGWPANNDDPWVVTAGKVGIAAAVASLTEAVLTGGNDNVVVPIVLWLCVKGLDI